jgi:hypothetical protein
LQACFDELPINLRLFSVILHPELVEGLRRESSSMDVDARLKIAGMTFGGPNSQCGRAGASLR